MLNPESSLAFFRVFCILIKLRIMAIMTSFNDVLPKHNASIIKDRYVDN